MTDKLNPIDVHVGKRLRMGRNMHGMSQDNVGSSIGVTFQQIQKYERGVNSVRAGKLWDLAKVLKVPITFFFEGFEGKGSANSDYAMDEATYAGAADSAKGSFGIEDLMGNKESVELMRAFNRVTDSKQRATIVNLVRSMADDKSLM